MRNIDRYNDNSISRRGGNDFELPPDAIGGGGYSVGSQLKRAARWTIFGKGGHGGWDNDGSANTYGSSRADESTSGHRSALLRTSNIHIHTHAAGIVYPGNRYYLAWEQVMLLLCLYSACVTPFEFAFFRRLPTSLAWFDVAISFFFAADLVLTFFVGYKDPKTFAFIDDHKLIAFRYLRTGFIFDFLNLFPWDSFYKAAGGDDGAEVMRWLLWLRLSRAHRVDLFFDRVERDIRVNYYAARIVRLLIVEFFCTHVAGCFFYYLATTIPSANEGDTWIGSLTLGSNSYENFRDLNLGKRYVTALYWAVVTMATLGYGDIHPVNPREMIFCMCFISFDMVLSAYLIGNITALIVKGSSTERYRDKMAALIQYMNRYRLPRGLRHQMREHVRLQFETDQVESDIIEDFPMSIRHKVARALFSQVVEDCYLFKECSHEFINQIVARGSAEMFMPLELVFQQRDAGDNMYIVCRGVLEEVSVGAEGLEEVENTVFTPDVVGEVAMLCNIPQPFTVRVKELAQLLRIDKQSFNNVISTYILDGRQVVQNLLERAKEEDSKVASLASEIHNLIGQQEAELVMATINAAARGDIEHLKHLMKAGANPSKADYDGRTALHLAASKGFDELTKFLIIEKADVNAKDNFGITPLFDALRSGHDSTAKILVERGATISLQEAGTELCNAVIHGNTGFLQRLLDHGVDPNSSDYDHRTPLHIAAAEGFLLITQLLVNHGADVFARDRWGNIPLEEAQRSGSRPVVQALEAAMLAKVGGNQLPAGQGEALHDSGTERTLTLAAAAVAAVTGESVMSESQEKNENTMKLTIGPQSAIEEIDEGGDKGLITLSSSPRLGLRSVGITPARSGLTSPRLGYGRAPRSRGGGVGAIQFNSEAARKRVTIYPYHPWTATRKAGRLIFVPPTVKDLLNAANLHFNETFTRILNSDGGEVPTIDLILDGDRLYFASDEDPEPDESSKLLG